MIFYPEAEKRCPEVLILSEKFLGNGISHMLCTCKGRMQMISGIVFRHHFFVILRLTDGSFKVDNSVGNAGISYPVIGGAADLLSYPVIIEASLTRQHRRLIDLYTVLMGGLYVVFIAVDKFLGRGEFIHSAYRIVHAGVDYVIYPVQDKHAIHSCLSYIAFKSLNAGGTPMLFYTAGIVAEDASAADSLANDSALYAELYETACEAIRPRLRRYRITERHNSVAIGIGKIIYRMNEHIGATVAVHERGDIVCRRVIAARKILCYVRSAVGMTAAQLGLFLYIHADKIFFAGSYGEFHRVADDPGSGRERKTGIAVKKHLAGASRRATKTLSTFIASVP